MSHMQNKNMHRTAHTLKAAAVILLVIAVAWIGLSLWDTWRQGDIPLKRSKGIRVTYTEGGEATLSSAAPLSAKEIFADHSDTIVCGIIQSVRNINIRGGQGESLTRGLITLQVDASPVNDGTTAETVTVLLPEGVGEAAGAEGSILSLYAIGTRGIFVLRRVTEQDRLMVGERYLYCDDLCDYTMYGADGFSVILHHGEVIFSMSMFDGTVDSFSSLREAEVAIRSLAEAYERP